MALKLEFTPEQLRVLHDVLGWVAAAGDHSEFFDGMPMHYVLFERVRAKVGAAVSELPEGKKSSA